MAVKPKYNIFQNSGFMIKMAWRHQKNVLWPIVVLAALGVGTNLIGLYAAPTILGAIQENVSVGRLLTLILLFTAGLMVVYAAREYVGLNRRFGRFELRQNILAMIQEKIMVMSYPNRDNQDIQRMLEKSYQTVNGTDKATQEIWNTFTDLLKNTAGFVIYLLLLASLNPLVIGLVLVTTLTGFFINNHLNGWGFRHRDEDADYSRKMNYLNDKASDHTIAKDIRIFGMKGWLEDVYKSTYRLYQDFVARGEKIYIWADAVDVILTVARNGVAYFFIIRMVLNNGLSAAQFLLYFTAVGGFTAWVNGILTEVSKLYRQSMDLTALREFLEYPEIFHFEDGEHLEPDTKKPYRIELKNVSFRYPGADKNTLEQLNLTIQAGEKLAVVGLNGAGKTTLVKLLCGFYDPTEGAILLNGEDIRKYNRRDYYRHFSAVFQDFSLLAGTIAENIAQDFEHIDMDKLKSCAAKAGMTERIKRLPNGYDTHLGNSVYEDAVELSGGETQRLMLARALYKDAPIIVLDEPTASLDPIAESDMYNKYNELTSKRTAIYISHRLASTRFCDRIILIDGNRIAEEGTHDSLMAKGAKYAELFEIQSRYYKEGVEENEQGQKESILS